MRNFSIHDTVWKNPGHELDKIAERILDKDNHFYFLGKVDEVISFIQKHGFKTSDMWLKILGDFHECHPQPDAGEIGFASEEEAWEDDNRIIIHVSYDRGDWESALDKWKGRGGILNENFFQGEVFAAVYKVYALGEIHIDRIEIFLTSLCTLNCEKCIAYIPYFKKPVITPLQQLKDDADLLFEKVDYVHKMKLLGGEGFLYPFLIEYVDYLYEHYGNRIGSIRIGTNGTIFPGQAVLEMCKRNQVTVDISDYTKAVPNMCMLEDVKAVCEEIGVAVDVKRTGEEWLDMGFPSNPPEEKTEEGLKGHFHKCAMFCRQFSKGKYYFCCSNYAAVLAGMFPDDENNYLDFRRKISKKELLEFELGFSRKGHTTFCNVCRGCSEEANPCRVEVARQVKRGR